MPNLLTNVLMTLLFILALLLIVLVLIQRGKGGGLAGAFGGMGGQSAFGTKAGDLFTKITIGVAALWIILCMISVRFLGTTEDRFEADMGGNAPFEEGLQPAPSGEQPLPAGTDSAKKPGAKPPKSDGQ